MTSDLAHNANKMPVQRPLELSREVHFIEGRHDIFDVLAQRAAQNVAWKTQVSGTLDLLEKARQSLENAENTIKHKDSQLAELHKHTLADRETGLLNKSGFTKVFVREVARAARGHSAGGLLVMFCLENMPMLERQYGEKAVHKAANLIARALEVEIRDMDCAARIETDEFVLLFSDASMEHALERLQVLALRLNKLALTHEGRDIHLSLSLGLKSYNGQSRPEHIFRAASEDLTRNRKEARA